VQSRFQNPINYLRELSPHSNQIPILADNSKPYHISNMCYQFYCNFILC